MQFAHDLTNCCVHGRLVYEHSATIADNPCYYTFCFSIYTESSSGYPPVMHHNLSIVYYIALGWEVSEIAWLEPISLRHQIGNRDM